jgi:serine phosphatase RsbU (regulator of sigma subunit)
MTTTGRPRGRTAWPILVVLLVGLLTTGSLAVAAGAAQRSNEVRLLHQRVGQAGLVLSTALFTVQTPLAAAGEAAVATGQPSSFDQVLEKMVGTSATAEFHSVSLWKVGEAMPTPEATLGTKPLLASQSSAEILKVLGLADRTGQLSVVGLLDASPPTIGYAYASGTTGDRVVVYAETALPANRTSIAQANPVFQDLDYALYFGKVESSHTLLAASTSHLPFTRRHAVTDIKFGDTSLRLDVTAKHQLGGRLLQLLPWLIGGIGALLSLAFAGITSRLLRRQADAQQLADENASLYASQRSVAQTLQLSLLPASLPERDDVVFGVRYSAGVDGIDIGGDWYDVIPTTDGRMLAVMGDVSGRGLGAATVMASLRFGIHAFASQGDDPATILTKLSALIDVERDGHFATVLLAEADIRGRTVTIANAGHPRPLVVDSEGTRFLEIGVGPPIGVRSAPYEEVVSPMAPHATLLMFTDGLFERRGEVLDTGLERLRSAAEAKGLSLEDLLSRIVDDLALGGAHDDTALLGMRWKI